MSVYILVIQVIEAIGTLHVCWILLLLLSFFHLFWKMTSDHYAAGITDNAVITGRVYSQDTSTEGQECQN